MWFYVKPIWDDLIKNIKDNHDIYFSISNFEKMFGVFKDNFITHLFLCVKYYIHVCKCRGTKPIFIGYTTLSKVIEKLNIILPKRGGNFQITLKTGGLIFNFLLFAIPFHFMGEYNVCFPLLLDCVFFVFRSDSVTLNMISCDNCCKFFKFAAIVILCDFCWLLWFVTYENKKYWKIKKNSLAWWRWKV